MNNSLKHLSILFLLTSLLSACGNSDSPTKDDKKEMSIFLFDAKRTKYTVDDSFDDYVCCGGLSVTLQYSDYSEKALEKSEFTYVITNSNGKEINSAEPFDAVGTYKVTVSRNNLNDSYNLTVIEGNPNKLLSISADNYRSEVSLNEDYSFDGIVNAFYDNGDEHAVTSYSTIGKVDTSSLGEKLLNISYKEGKISKSIGIKIFVVSAPTYAENEIKLEYPAKGQVFDAYDKRYDEYLNATNDVDSVAALEKYSLSNPEAKKITLSWKSNGSSNYTVHVSNNLDFNDEQVFTTNSQSITLKNLIPNKNYYWKVNGSKLNDESKVNYFSTDKGNVRFINAGSIQNIRDFGGWVGEGNKTIKYGLLYRGNCLNGYAGLATLGSEGKKIFNNELKINTEIDLRTKNQDDNLQTSNYFDSSKPYLKATISQYTYVLDSVSFADLKTRKGDEYAGNGSPSLISAQSIKNIIDTLADSSSYPIYMHCNVGADRTGTMSLLIGGLLGVSYDDLMKDYELTSFSSASGKRYRSSIENGSFNKDSIYKSSKSGNFIAMQVYYDAIMYYYSKGGDFQDACENFLKSFANVSDISIAKLKENLLDKC